jgi:ABC-2 type transport system ATP-binding protein
LASADSANAFAALGVSKSFGRKLVLDDLSLDVPKGRALGLLGENGSGKTTLLKILLGLLPADAGNAWVSGEPSGRLPAAVRGRIGYVPQSPDQFAALTGKAMLSYVGSFYPKFDASYARDLAGRWRVSLRTPIGALSPGQQQRLSILRALSVLPDLIVLDEPIASIDPATRTAIVEELLEIMQSRAATLIFSSHITGDLERLCSHFAVVAAGKIALHESTATIRSFVRIIVRGDESDLAHAQFDRARHVRKARGGEYVVVIDEQFADEVLRRLPPGCTALHEQVAVEATLTEWMR